MESTFRKSMAWLHTWAGVVIGALLFVVFWMGTLSVFDHEIDRWMMPMTRRLKAPTPVLLDATARPAAERLAAGATQWIALFPTDRASTLRLEWRDASDKEITRHLDPATGADLNVGTHAGTGFIYRFHYQLNIAFKDIGAWLVGFAAMSMLVALVSGVIIHKRIFIDFFIFRPQKHIRLAALDLHNLTGVLMLPFCFFIALSGLILAFSTYFPSGRWAIFANDKKAFRQDVYGIYARDKANAPAALSSLDAMLDEARRLWGDGRPYFLRVTHPGDANGYVEVRRFVDDRVARDSNYLFFDGASGALISRAGSKPVRKVYRFITNLHMLGFENWTLRWLFFLAGLAACVMIATGFLVWMEARRAQHAANGLAGVRAVEALAVGAVPGLVIATLAFFIANRLLPSGDRFAGIERAALEMWVFYSVWILGFAHAAWRGRAAWSEQSRALGVMALAAVFLNWITTGDHLFRTLNEGLYGVAGMDAMLLLGAGVAWCSARRLSRRRAPRAAVSVPLSSGRMEREAEYA